MGQPHNMPLWRGYILVGSLIIALQCISLYYLLYNLLLLCCLNCKDFLVYRVILIFFMWYGNLLCSIDLWCLLSSSYLYLPYFFCIFYKDHGTWSYIVVLYSKCWWVLCIHRLDPGSSIFRIFLYYLSHNFVHRV